MSNPEYRDAPGPWTRADQQEAHAADLTPIVKEAVEIMESHAKHLDELSAANSPEAKQATEMDQLIDEYAALIHQRQTADDDSRRGLDVKMSTLEMRMSKLQIGQDVYNRQVDKVLHEANAIGTLMYQEQLAEQEALEEEAMIAELHRVFVSHHEDYQQRSSSLYGDIAALPPGSKRTSLSSMYLKVREEYRQFLGQIREVGYSVDELVADSSTANLTEWKSFVEIIGGLNGQLEMIAEAGHFHQEE